MSDTTNTESGSTDRSTTPFVAATQPISTSPLKAFSSATQECRDGATNDEMIISDDDDETVAREKDEDAIFRSASSSPGNDKLSFIHRLEPTIGEASDEEDQDEGNVDEEEYAYNFNFRRNELSESDDSRQGSPPSHLCLKRANPIYDIPAGDSGSETGTATCTDNEQIWPSSEFESPSKRSRKHVLVEEGHDIDETEDEASEPPAPILTTPALYFRAENIYSSSTTLGEVSTNDDNQRHQLSLEADEVEGHNISSIFASAE